MEGLFSHVTRLRVLIVLSLSNVFYGPFLWDMSKYIQQIWETLHLCVSTVTSESHRLWITFFFAVPELFREYVLLLSLS